MFYGYEIIPVERKLNKKKVFLTILIICVVILLSVFGAIKIVELNKQKQKENENTNTNEQIEEQEKNDEQKIQEEKMKKEKEKEEKEKQRRKNIVENNFTEEQMQAIENIYETEEKRVFLTFDDGPTQSVTPFILDLLKQENIKATFFVLGNRVKANPELIQREYEEGHYIANHGYTHKYSQIYTNEDTVLEEYNYTEEALQEALSNPNYHSKIFRFPGGSTGGYYREIKSVAKQYLKDNGIVSLDWNSLSKDAEGASTTEELLDNVIETIGEKQSVVILMHDASDKILTYEVLPEVINYLRENGYQFKNMYDIL